MAFRFDILSTPSASVTVVTMGKPSGIAATASDTVLHRWESACLKPVRVARDIPPMVNMSNHDLLCSTPMIQMMPMTPKDRMERVFASSSILSCNGVRFSSTYGTISMSMDSCRGALTSCIIEKITPNSVSTPVAITTPDPRPMSISTRQSWKHDHETDSRTVTHERSHIRDTCPLGERYRLRNR